MSPSNDESPVVGMLCGVWMVTGARGPWVLVGAGTGAAAPHCDSRKALPPPYCCQRQCVGVRHPGPGLITGTKVFRAFWVDF